MYKLLCAVLLLVNSLTPLRAELQQSIKHIKPSVVAIGIFSPLASPRVRLVGTGFAVTDGSKIVTNHHVIATTLNPERNESYVVMSGNADNVTMHQIIESKIEPAYDLSVLTIASKLPAVTLASSTMGAEGSEIAFTGFPITSVLGLYPATHRGIVAAHTPIAIPVDHSSQLQAAALRKLRKPFLVYQLDATAYPGNSGSPLYKADTAEVIGIINKVYVKSTREAVLSDPSGITYAIPVQALLPLLAD
jgi:S1-C subfamily serine protease